MQIFHRKGSPIICLIVLSFLIPAIRAGAFEFRFTGFIDYYGGIEQSIGYENLRTRIYVKPRLSGSIDAWSVDWVVSLKLWVQPLGSPLLLDLLDIPDETYLKGSWGNFDLVLGQKYLSYGFADIYGPLNVAHAGFSSIYSLDDGYDSKRPVPLIQLIYYPTFEDTLELVYIPITKPDKERIDKVTLEDKGINFGTVHWEDTSYISDNLHSVFFRYTRYAERVDFQAFYGYYTSHTPDFDNVLPSSRDAEITPDYNKKHTAGVAYAFRLGSTTISQDIAFTLTSDFEGTNIGAENSSLTINTQILAALPFGILSQWTLGYAYFFNYNTYTGAGTEEGDFLAEQIRDFHAQPRRQIAFIVAHFERNFLRERMKVQLNIGYFFSAALYFAPRISYRITDLFTAEVGADIRLLDPTPILLRRNPTNDNFYVRMLFEY